MKSFKIKDLSEAWSILHQSVLGLAMAENALEFEHLHWGNVLIRRTEEVLLESTLDGQKKIVESHGVRVSLIDFGLSQIKKGTVQIIHIQIQTWNYFIRLKA